MCLVRRREIYLENLLLLVLLLWLLLFLLFFLLLWKRDALIYAEKVVLYPFNFVINKINSYGSLKDVREVNDILETSIDRIDSIEAENIELRRQLDELKEELSIDYALTDYEYLNATVISRNVGFIRTSTFTSDVRLITTSDTNNKISVHVSSNGSDLYGLINNYDYNDNLLEVEGISNTKDVNIGDYVYTSGLGGIFPSGILIGKVSEITTDAYDLAKIIKVTPSPDFNDINYVSILKRKSAEEW